MPLWLRALGDFLAPILSGAIAAILAAFRARRLDAERDALSREAGRDDAALETKDAINEAADARANLPPVPADPDDLARELRRSGTGPRSNRRRPF